MTIKCPNCGANYEVEDGNPQSYCMYCGGKLPKTESEFKDPFQSDSAADGFVDPLQASAPATPNYFSQPAQGYAQPQGFGNESAPGISSSMGNSAANKALKNIRSCAIFVFVISLVRLFSTISALGTIAELSDLASTLSDYYATMVKDYVNVGYAEMVMMIVLFAASIAMLVFAVKIGKCRLPSSNEDVFRACKSEGIAAAIASVLFVIFLIIEVVGVIRYKALEIAFEAEESQMLIMIASIAWSCFIFAGTLYIAVQSLKLSKSKVEG